MTAVDTQVESNVAAHRELCFFAGADPEAELVEARIVHGIDPRVWVAFRVACHRLRRTMPQLTPMALSTVLDIYAVACSARDDAAVRALAGGAVGDLGVELVEQYNLPESAALVCAASPCGQVRRRLANNTRFERVLTRLAVDSDATVRVVVAHNTATPARVRAELVCDTDADVRTAARGYRADGMYGGWNDLDWHTLDPA